jgi:hypothetical protein
MDLSTLTVRRLEGSTTLWLPKALRRIPPLMKWLRPVNKFGKSEDDLQQRRQTCPDVRRCRDHSLNLINLFKSCGAASAI